MQEFKSKIDIKQLKTRYSDLYAEKSKWLNLWDDIARFIRIEKRDIANKEKDQSGQDIDQYVNDPTSLLSISSSASNLYGIIIGDGNFCTIEANDELEVQGEVDPDSQDYITYVNKRLLQQINHENANFKKSFLEHLKDQQTFGTSGIGEFISNDYIKGKSDNIFDFLSFGVDNITIDEGRNGLIDTIYVNYNWRINKIVNTFCVENGVLSDNKISQLPDKMKESYKNNPSDKYQLYLAIVDNEFFKKDSIGKFGAKFMGVWYVESPEYVLDVEFYNKLPVHIVRADKLRGEIYGRADGTKCLSSIKLLNYVMGDIIETLDKFVKPAMGVLDGSLSGDKAIDTSPGQWTAMKLPTGSDYPVFPLVDVKDPTALISVLIPYLKETITTAFKTDILLDMNNQVAKTATEMIQRYNIRSKLLFSIIFQQVNELLLPMLDNLINTMYDLGEIGYTERQIALDNEGIEYKIIPEQIVKLRQKGKKWYKIKFNSEISKMERAGELDNINQFLNLVTGLSQFNPNVLQAIDWFKILQRVEELLNYGESYLINPTEYKKLIDDLRNMQNQSMNNQQALDNSQVNSNNANAINKLAQS